MEIEELELLKKYFNKDFKNVAWKLYESTDDTHTKYCVFSNETANKLALNVYYEQFLGMSNEHLDSVILKWVKEDNFDPLQYLDEGTVLTVLNDYNQCNNTNYKAFADLVSVLGADHLCGAFGKELFSFEKMAQMCVDNMGYAILATDGKVLDIGNGFLAFHQ